MKIGTALRHLAGVGNRVMPRFLGVVSRSDDSAAGSPCESRTVKAFGVDCAWATSRGNPGLRDRIGFLLRPGMQSKVTSDRKSVSSNEWCAGFRQVEAGTDGFPIYVNSSFPWCAMGVVADDMSFPA